MAKTVATVQPTAVMRIFDGQRIEERVILFILKAHAEFNTPQVIQKMLLEEFGPDNGVACPSYYFNQSEIRIKKLVNLPDNRVVVAAYRGGYLNRIKDVPVANKRVRLDDMEEVRERMVEAIRATEPGQVKELVMVAKGLNETLANAREELEGKSIVLNQMNIIGDFSDKSDDELIDRRDELIRKVERTIAGRTTGINSNPEGAIPAEIIKPA